MCLAADYTYEECACSIFQYHNETGLLAAPCVHLDDSDAQCCGSTLPAHLTGNIQLEPLDLAKVDQAKLLCREHPHPSAASAGYHTNALLWHAPAMAAGKSYILREHPSHAGVLWGVCCLPHPHGPPPGLPPLAPHRRAHPLSSNICASLACRIDKCISHAFL